KKAIAYRSSHTKICIALAGGRNALLKKRAIFSKTAFRRSFNSCAARGVDDPPSAEARGRTEPPHNRVEWSRRACRRNAVSKCDFGRKSDNWTSKRSDIVISADLMAWQGPGSAAPCAREIHGGPSRKRIRTAPSYRQGQTSRALPAEN